METVQCNQFLPLSSEVPYEPTKKNISFVDGGLSDNTGLTGLIRKLQFSGSSQNVKLTAKDVKVSDIVVHEKYGRGEIIGYSDGNNKKYGNIYNIEQTNRKNVMNIRWLKNFRKKSVSLMIIDESSEMAYIGEKLSLDNIEVGQWVVHQKHGNGKVTGFSDNQGNRYGDYEGQKTGVAHVQWRKADAGRSWPIAQESELQTVSGRVTSSDVRVGVTIVHSKFGTGTVQAFVDNNGTGFGEITPDELLQVGQVFPDAPDWLKTSDTYGKNQKARTFLQEGQKSGFPEWIQNQALIQWSKKLENPTVFCNR
eukprot:UN24273